MSRHHDINNRRITFSLVAILLILFGFSLYTTIIPLFSNEDRVITEETIENNSQNPDINLVNNEDDSNKGQSTTTAETNQLLEDGKLFEYFEVTDGCGPHYEGECLRVRSGPGTDYPVVTRLRNGVVLKVGDKVEVNNIVWYKIVFDEWLRFPDRVQGDWYVAADYVKVLLDEGDKTIWENSYSTTTQKNIIVDRSEQKIYAYDGEELFMIATTSTGLELTPTPRGTYKVFKKTPSRYMQGPLPNLVDQQYYDLPGVPWNLYFTDGGAVIHGAYWHNSFGVRYSHGCVNLPPNIAHDLYVWADLGTKVIVKD